MAGEETIRRTPLKAEKGASSQATDHARAKEAKKVVLIPTSEGSYDGKIDEIEWSRGSEEGFATFLWLLETVLGNATGGSDRPKGLVTESLEGTGFLAVCRPRGSSGWLVDFITEVSLTWELEVGRVESSDWVVGLHVLEKTCSKRAFLDGQNLPHLQH